MSWQHDFYDFLCCQKDCLSFSCKFSRHTNHQERNGTVYLRLKYVKVGWNACSKDFQSGGATGELTSQAKPVSYGSCTCFPQSNLAMDNAWKVLQYWKVTTITSEKNLLPEVSKLAYHSHALNIHSTSISVLSTRASRHSSQRTMGARLCKFRTKVSCCNGSSPGAGMSGVELGKKWILRGKTGVSSGKNASLRRKIKDIIQSTVTCVTEFPNRKCFLSKQGVGLIRHYLIVFSKAQASQADRRTQQKRRDIHS